MPCNHKFQSYLNLERLSFKPTTLIIGTFNPEWPSENTAEWFYGRIEGSINDHNSGNHFWAVLPRLYRMDSLKSLGKKEKWKEFCSEKKIAITDLISCIQDADQTDQNHKIFLKGYSDKKIAEEFQNHQLVQIVNLLQANPTIKNVYLTRGIGETFWKNKWKPIKLYCDLNNIYNRTLLTPSDYAYYQQGKYNKLHPEATLNREDFILKRWQEKWHNL